MCLLQIRAQCNNKFFEILPGEVENTELMVEDAISQILLDLFEEGMVDDVSICFAAKQPLGLQECSIQIQAQYSCECFVLQPDSQEHTRLEAEKCMRSLLQELFGTVSVYNATHSQIPGDACIECALSCSA